jgi:hypothetical protein
MRSCSGDSQKGRARTGVGEGEDGGGSDDRDRRCHRSAREDCVVNFGFSQAEKRQYGDVNKRAGRVL